MRLYLFFPVGLFCVAQGFLLVRWWSLCGRLRLLQARPVQEQGYKLLRSIQKAAEQYDLAPSDPQCLLVRVRRAREAPTLAADMYVPVDFFAEGTPWEPQQLFDLYCKLASMSTDGELICTTWNCLCGLLTALLAQDSRWRGRELDFPDTNLCLAITHLLTGPYHIDHCSSFQKLQKESLYVADIPAEIRYAAERCRATPCSSLQGSFFFLRNVMRANGFLHLAMLGALITAHSFLFARCLLCVTRSEALCFSDMVRSQTLLKSRTTFVAFSRDMLSQFSGQLMALSLLVSSCVDMVDTVKRVFASIAVQESLMHLRVEAYSALARADYVSSVTWRLPEKVFAALANVSTFTFDDIDWRFSNWIGNIGAAWTLWRFPIECTVAWCVEQFNNYLDLAWSRLSVLSSYLAAQEFDGSESASASQSVPHYGLSLLVILTEANSFSSSTWGVIIRHVAFPVAVNPRKRVYQPERILPLTLYSCFSELRSSGFEELAMGDCAMNYQSFGCDGDASLGDRIIAEIMNDAHMMPDIAALAVAQYTKSSLFELGALEMERTAVNLRSIRQWKTIFPRAIGYGWPPCSPYLYDLKVYQHTMESTDVASQGYEFLHRFEKSKPRIDSVPWNACLTLEPGPWSIEFVHVSFRYPGASCFVLKDVSFRVERSHVLGIIGFSGAGKTTVLLLLARIYLPQSGIILVNNVPIERYAPRDLRRRIGNVWQEEAHMRFLQNLSIESNVALGDICSATETAIMQALQSALALQFVQSRSCGAKEILSLQNYSGGEVERLAIARALLMPKQKVGIYLLDESTNALDTSTERHIYEVLGTTNRHLCTDGSNPTVIMTAHRLSSVQEADEIIVLVDGEIRERGTWRQLLSNPTCECFRKLYNAQCGSDRW